MSAAKVKPVVDVDKVRTLLDAWIELSTKQEAIYDEMRRLLGGGPSIGELLKLAEGAFETLWTERYKTRYFWVYTKDRPALKRLILQIGNDELAARFRRYLSNDDPFFTKARHSFGVFVATVNQHAAMAESTLTLEGGSEDRPVGCTHLPPCKDDVEHTRKKVQEMRGSHSGPVGDVL